MNQQRPALIIDGGSRGDIGVIRSLGLGGVPIHLLVTDPTSPSAVSRYVRRVHHFPGLNASDEACLAAIRLAAQTMETRPIMLATGDRALALMSRLRPALAELLDHDLAPAEVIETCLDKARFAPMAKHLGLTTPETVVPASIAEARTAAAALTYPVFVKPVNRAEWEGLPTTIVQSVKGQRFDSHDALLRLLDALEQRGASRFVIQECVEGGDEEHLSVHAYVLPDGTVTGTFTGVKPRLFPPHAGVGAFVVSRRVPDAEAVALQAIATVGYTGFIDLQFKRDVRSGAYKLLEINCRYSTWAEFPSRAGCNFPLVAYATIAGQSLPRLEQREGVAWLDLERDLIAMSTYRATGEWTWRSYLRSLAPVRYGAYFAWDDPAPFFRKVRNR